MKHFFFPAVVAILCGIHCAVASPVARKAYVMPKLKKGEMKLEKIVPKIEESYFKKNNVKEDKVAEWKYLMIPYELCGKGKNVKSGEKVDYPLYVDELKVHVYIMFDMGRDQKKGAPKYVRLDKEITYVDIPLPKKGQMKEKGSSVQVGMNDTVNAAVFFSPADLAMLSDELVAKKDKAEKVSDVDLDKNIAAVAVEFFHKGEEVTDLENGNGIANKKEYKEKGIIVKPGADQFLTDYWWRKERESVIQMRDISETPFAPFYAQAFPPTSKLYGGSAAAAPSAADTTDTTGMDGGFVPPASTETTVEEEESTKSSSKKKNKKNRNR